MEELIQGEKNNENRFPSNDYFKQHTTFLQVASSPIPDKTQKTTEYRHTDYPTGHYQPLPPATLKNMDKQHGHCFSVVKYVKLSSSH